MGNPRRFFKGGSGGKSYGIYRSSLEQRIAGELKEQGVEFTYESLKIKFVRPAETSTYTPDFILKNGIIIESKGLFTSDDRKKHLIIQEQHPELDIRFVFSNPNTKLSKMSATTYGAWCERHGFQYAAKSIPVDWIREKPKPERRSVLPPNLCGVIDVPA